MSFDQVSVPDFKIWSIKSPNLHTLTIQYLDYNDTSNVLDAITVRFGMRLVGTKQFPDGNFTRLTINDEIIKIHGHDRHTMWPDTGSALTYDQILSD